MPQIRVGTLRFMIDGVQYALAGDFEVMGLRNKREPVVGPDGSVGMKVTPVAPMIKGPIRDREGLDVAAIFEMTDITITGEMENGKAWVLRNAFYSGEGTIGVAEGEIDGQWTGESIEEVA